MKKLAFCCLITLVAVGLRAATLNWGTQIGAELTPVTGDEGFSNYVAYLCVGETVDVASSIADSLQSGTWDTASALDSKGFTFSPLTSQWTLPSNPYTTVDDMYGSGTYYWCIVVLDDNAENYLVSTAVEGTASSGTSNPFTISLTGDELVATSGGWQQVGGGDTPIDPDVPEPTALALLALGVAGVALRRRVA